jgi:carboxylesterase
MMKESKEKKIIQGCEETELRGNEVGCLLIHGFRSCPFEMKEYGQYLNDLGFTVKTCLLPGHGTEPADLLNVKWEQWLGEVENSFESLQKKSNKIFVAGLSTGGSLALYLASKQNVDGVIALAPGLFLKQRNAILSHILKYVWKFKSIKSGPDVSVRVESRVYPKVPVSIVSELLSLFKSLKSKLHLIKTPALIIYSIQDHVVRPKSSITIYNKISSQNKHLIELKKSFHILTMDVEKEKVFEESGKFINKILSS